jgi:hypothetical protein
MNTTSLMTPILATSTGSPFLQHRNYRQFPIIDLPLPTDRRVTSTCQADRLGVPFERDKKMCVLPLNFRYHREFERAIVIRAE